MIEMQNYGQPMGTPPSYGHRSTMPPPGYTRSSGKGYLALIITGIIILMVGGIIYVCWGFLDDPDEDSDSDDREKYSDNVRLISTTGNLLQYIGIIILSIGLVLGAVKDETIHQNVRLGMLIAMGLIIGFKIFYTIIPYRF